MVVVWLLGSVGSDKEHSLADFMVSCVVVQGGGGAFQCSTWDESVGGMKLNVDLAVSPQFRL